MVGSFFSVQYMVTVYIVHCTVLCSELYGQLRCPLVFVTCRAFVIVLGEHYYQETVVEIFSGATEATENLSPNVLASRPAWACDYGSTRSVLFLRSRHRIGGNVKFSAWTTGFFH